MFGVSEGVDARRCLCKQGALAGLCMFVYASEPEYVRLSYYIITPI